METMQIYNRLEDFPSNPPPIILTIGNFDGVHRGHQHILDCMQHYSSKNSQICVVTFNNHPSEILRPTDPTPLICTQSHKIQLLKQEKINHLILLHFDILFAQQTAEEFIQKLRAHIPFSHLILGHDATLGKNRQGNRAKILSLAEQLNFKVHYIEAYCEQDHLISSTQIRKALVNGELDRVEQFLGRPYSIYSVIRHGEGQGKQIGYPTANIKLPFLCLPPYGVYKVTLKHKERLYPSIANLGLAPTIKTSATPLLETHLFSFSDSLYGEEVEVIFHKFIRPEKKFDSVEELKQQIQRDISNSK